VFFDFQTSLVSSQRRSLSSFWVLKLIKIVITHATSKPSNSVGSEEYSKNNILLGKRAAMVKELEHLASKHKVIGSSLVKRPLVMLGRATSHNFPCVPGE